jgi:hypothetical protein
MVLIRDCDDQERSAFIMPGTRGCNLPITGSFMRVLLLMQGQKSGSSSVINTVFS